MAPGADNDLVITTSQIEVAAAAVADRLADQMLCSCPRCRAAVTAHTMAALAGPDDRLPGDSREERLAALESRVRTAIDVVNRAPLHV